MNWFSIFELRRRCLVTWLSRRTFLDTLQLAALFLWFGSLLLFICYNMIQVIWRQSFILDALILSIAASDRLIEALANVGVVSFRSIIAFWSSSLRRGLRPHYYFVFWLVGCGSRAFSLVLKCFGWAWLTSGFLTALEFDRLGRLMVCSLDICTLPFSLDLGSSSVYLLSQVYILNFRIFQRLWVVFSWVGVGLGPRRRLVYFGSLIS